MKKWLYVILGIEIVADIVIFFMLLYSSLFAALFGTALNVLSLIPIIAIICNMKDIEDIQYDMSKMRYTMRKIEDSLARDRDSTEESELVVGASVGVWECVKCGTVNKEGTNRCDNCKAAYSPEYNPTDDPSKKKKVSRWIKYK